MKKYICIISAAVLLLATGCNKNPLSSKGDITFGSVSDNVATRTAYGTAKADSTFTDGKLTHIAIVWEKNDIIRIISPEAAVTGNGSNLHYADYTVVDVEETDANGSSAALVNTNPNGLAWTDASTYSFYAVYPSTTPISLEEATYGQVTADFLKAEPTLPTATTSAKIGDVTYTKYTPSIKDAVMSAVTTGVKENDAKPQVKLHFKPAFTAIEFNLSSQDDDIVMTELQLVADAEGSDYLAGPFTMNAGDLSSVAVTTASASKTVTLSTGDGLTLTEEEGASLTMFILPKNNASTLTLRLTSKEGDGTKTSFVKLLKNGSPFVFEAGKKYRINGFKAPGSTWKIFIAAMDVAGWGTPVDSSYIVE